MFQTVISTLATLFRRRAPFRVGAPAANPAPADYSTASLTKLLAWASAYLHRPDLARVAVRVGRHANPTDEVRDQLNLLFKKHHCPSGAPAISLSVREAGANDDPDALHATVIFDSTRLAQRATAALRPSLGTGQQVESDLAEAMTRAHGAAVRKYGAHLTFSQCRITARTQASHAYLTAKTLQLLTTTARQIKEKFKAAVAPGYALVIELDEKATFPLGMGVVDVALEVVGTRGVRDAKPSPQAVPPKAPSPRTPPQVFRQRDPGKPAPTADRQDRTKGTSC